MMMPRSFYCTIAIFLLSAVYLCGHNRSDISPKDIRPLEFIDFSISDGTSNIILGMTSSEFHNIFDKPELEINHGLAEEQRHYWGDNLSGDVWYRFVFYEYADLTVFFSNINYDFEGRSWGDEYIVASLLLNNVNFKTYRGISLGSSKDDVIKAYGCGNETTVEVMSLSFNMPDNTVETTILNNPTILIYTLDHLELEIILDSKQIVRSIFLTVNPKGEPFTVF